MSEMVPGDLGSIETLREQYPRFAEGLTQYLVLVDQWQQAMEPRFIPTRGEIPENYRWLSNMGFHPYSLELHRDLELQRRGSPILICRQAFLPRTDTLNPRDISSYGGGVDDYEQKISSEWAAEYWLTFGVYQGLLKHHHVVGNQKKNLTGEGSYIAWANEQGLLIPAFMASTILSCAGRIRQDAFVQTYSEADIALYEKLAAQTTEESIPKFRPLSIGQVAGLAIGALTRDFLEHPELNDEYQLTKPFEPAGRNDSLE